jgi:hypothetical protein
MRRSAQEFNERLDVKPHPPPLIAGAKRLILAAMPYFLVHETCGPAWDYARGRREQDGWDEHAAFMDKLVEDGFVFLGGPTGDPDTGDPLLVEAEDEAGIRARLADDPWMGTVLTIRDIEPWTIWLRKESGAKA